jgi:hypothetical protein
MTQYYIVFDAGCITVGGVNALGYKNGEVKFKLRELSQHFQTENNIINFINVANEKLKTAAGKKTLWHKSKNLCTGAKLYLKNRIPADGKYIFNINDDDILTFVKNVEDIKQDDGGEPIESKYGEDVVVTEIDSELKDDVEQLDFGIQQEEIVTELKDDGAQDYNIQQEEIVTQPEEIEIATHPEEIVTQPEEIGIVTKIITERKEDNAGGFQPTDAQINDFMDLFEADLIKTLEADTTDNEPPPNVPEVNLMKTLEDADDELLDMLEGELAEALEGSDRDVDRDQEAIELNTEIVKILDDAALLSTADTEIYIETKEYSEYETVKEIKRLLSVAKDCFVRISELLPKLTPNTIPMYQAEVEKLMEDIEIVDSGQIPAIRDEMCVIKQIIYSILTHE